MSEWQPIETAPKDGTELLCYVRNKSHGDIYDIAEWWNGGWWWDWCDDPTHWMPLPPAPATQPETKGE